MGDTYLERVSIAATVILTGGCFSLQTQIVSQMRKSYHCKQCCRAGQTLTGSGSRSGDRLRLREKNKICYTNLKKKVQLWKIKGDNCTFLKVYRYLFVLSISVTIVIIWLPHLCHLRTPKSHSNRPAPFLRLRLHNTDCKGIHIYRYRCRKFSAMQGKKKRAKRKMKLNWYI